MKKIISAILAAALLFSLCSCARAESVTLERGTVENGVYENGSMGIKINLGEGWTFYSDDEIEENIRPSDFMPGDDTKELEAGDIFCDMYCSNDAATNINISYEYVGTSISIAKYLSALEASVKEQFMELEGFTVTETENTTADTRPRQSAHDPDLIRLILPVIGIPLPAEVTGKILLRDLHGFFLTLIDLPCNLSADLPELAL